jgi:FkbM family methyltransferase
VHAGGAVYGVIRRLAWALGLDVRRRPRGVEPLRSRARDSFALLRRLGFSPGTVIDVGVAHGTPDLYAVFPDAYFLLIEPLPDFEPVLRQILEGRQGRYVMAAAGRAPGVALLNVHRDHLAGSSLYREAMGPAADGEPLQVEVVTLDAVLQDAAALPPYLLKVDVQGAELDVLEGGAATLEHTEVVVLEVSLFEFMRGAPVLDEVVAYMKDRGFVAWDIIPGCNRPLDGALAQVDIVFVKERGSLRADHRYADPGHSGVVELGGRSDSEIRVRPESGGRGEVA